MKTSVLSAVAFGLLIVAAPAAFAIHVEPNVAGFESPAIGIAATALREDAVAEGDAAPALTSEFTRANTAGFKRKAFPPGYTRSGYSFADEDLAAAPEPVQKGEPAAQPEAQDAPRPADPIR